MRILHYLGHDSYLNSCILLMEDNLHCFFPRTPLFVCLLLNLCGFFENRVLLLMCTPCWLASGPRLDALHCSGKKWIMVSAWNMFRSYCVHCAVLEEDAGLGLPQRSLIIYLCICIFVFANISICVFSEDMLGLKASLVYHREADHRCTEKPKWSNADSLSKYYLGLQLWRNPGVDFKRNGLQHLNAFRIYCYPWNPRADKKRSGLSERWLYFSRSDCSECCVWRYQLRAWEKNYAMQCEVHILQYISSCGQIYTCICIHI